MSWTTITTARRDTITGSIQSLAGSWSRAAEFTASPLIPSDFESFAELSRRRSRLLSIESQRSNDSVLTQDDFDSASVVASSVANPEYNWLRKDGQEVSQPHRRSVSVAGETTSLLAPTTQSRRPSYILRSNLTQMIFNTINLILGVGLLGFPLAFKRAGILIALLIFVWSCSTTLWTARMIEKCLSRHRHLQSFTDLAYAAFGPKARIIVMSLVALELTATSVAQIGMFVDGLETLFVGSSAIMWKLICGAAFIPLSCAPLRYLGITSALCALCFMLLSFLMILTGIIRMKAPGSLHEPAHVTILPAVWSAMPSSIGMILSAWGGHTVFPELYQDMREPEKFFKGIKTSYAITFPIYLLVGVLGYLMFGDRISGPLTSELIALESTPGVKSYMVIALLAFMPIAKVPLNIYPLASALERLYKPENTLAKALARPTIRGAIGSFFVILAIVFPDIDKVMSILGVVAGLMIAVILPTSCYLKIMKDELPTVQRIIAFICVLIAVCLGVGGLSSVVVPSLQ